MDYEGFKKAVEQSFIGYMPWKFRNHEVRVQTVYKVNQKLDSLSLFDPDSREQQISPAIYIDHMYRSYAENESLEQTLAEAADAMERAYGKTPARVSLGDGKDRIIMQLINTEKNRELLQKSPHREICDLSLIYRLLLERDKEIRMSIQIDERMAGQMGMTEPELYERAMANTERLLPPVLVSLEETVHQNVFGGESPEEPADLLSGTEPLQTGVYVLTNRMKLDGAASMLYEGRLQELAERMGSNLFILPSSVHEVILVPVSMGEAKFFAEMVASVNEDEVRPEDRLSNEVYRYDKNLRTLEIASKSPERTERELAAGCLAGRSR